MIQTFFIRLLQMLALVAVQVLVLSHVSFWGYGTPIICAALFLYMPQGSSRVATLLWAFVAGLVVDVFSNTPGVCSAAMTLTGMLQPPLLNLMVPRDSAENVVATYTTMGKWNHIRYIFILFLIHHTTYFLLDSFSFFSLTETGLCMASSLAVSLLIVFILETFRKRES